MDPPLDIWSCVRISCSLKPQNIQEHTVASKAGPSGWFKGLPQLQGALCIVYKLRAQSLKNN